MEIRRRIDERNNNELRPVKFFPGFVDYPEGSVLIQVGKTRVLCNVSVQEGVPAWMAGKARGWVSAEYGMLPRATHTRNAREYQGPAARTQEIKRLIGRSMRAMVDLNLLGERTLLLDCDVLQADGGTRTAAITGGYVALVIALKRLIQSGVCPAGVLQGQVAAVSVGMISGQAMLDLCYQEDSHAEFDANLVMNAAGEFIEVQGTAEGRSISRVELDQLFALAESGIQQLMELQRCVLEDQGFG